MITALMTLEIPNNSEIIIRVTSQSGESAAEEKLCRELIKPILELTSPTN
jgi:hypothetical protein